MAWDSTRPVPWQRLTRDWVIYVSIMAIVFAVVYRDDLTVGPFIGLLLSGPLFIGVGAVLAKFGYQRKTLRDLRRETDQRKTATAQVGATAGAPRARPAPTKRTSTGPGQRPKKGRRR